MAEVVGTVAALALLLDGYLLPSIRTIKQQQAYELLNSFQSDDLHTLADAVDDLATMIDEIQIERGGR